MEMDEAVTNAVRSVRRSLSQNAQSHAPHEYGQILVTRMKGDAAMGVSLGAQGTEVSEGRRSHWRALCHALRVAPPAALCRGLYAAHMLKAG